MAMMSSNNVSRLPIQMAMCRRHGRNHHHLWTQSSLWQQQRFFVTTTTKINKNNTNTNDYLATLILLRHGQSTWNAIPTFTGWCDAPLTKRGIEEAKAAGRLLAERGYTNFNVTYTSALQRARVSGDLALHEATSSTQHDNNNNHNNILHTAWQLNERHYGALQGKRKNDRALLDKYGEKQIHKWRRQYDARPPPMKVDNEYYQPPPAPRTESLADCQERVLRYWDDTILKSLLPGSTVLIAAHSNTLRALVCYLDNVPIPNIPHVRIPNGVPCIYHIDPKSGKPVVMQQPQTDCSLADIDDETTTNTTRSHGQWLFSVENHKRLREQIGVGKKFLNAMFEAWDINKDGVLSRDEIKTGLRAFMGGNDISVGAIAAKILEEIESPTDDDDGNRTLNLQEFEAAAIKACQKYMPELLED